MRLAPPQTQLPLPGVMPSPRAVVVVKNEVDQRLEDLAKLGELKTQGVVTDEEFATLKARILGD